MADILDYDELPSPTSDVALYGVDDPTGTPIDKHILIKNMDLAVDKTIELTILTNSIPVSVIDGAGDIYFTVPPILDGRNLIDADASVAIASSSGLPTFQIYNLTQTADMLSTKITIDENELTSYTAATPAVPDTGNDDVATGDQIRIDCDVAGTGTKGLTIILKFRKP